MSILSRAASQLGHNISEETHKVLATIENTPEYITAIAKKAGGAIGFGPAANPFTGSGPHVRPIKPASYPGLPGSLQVPVDTASGCATGGAKPWTITSTVSISAAALSADTDLGSTTNPFSSTNSGFFGATAGVFPWPFLSYGIGGMIMAQIPNAETEFVSVCDSMYLSMRGATELARYSLTRDLGFGIAKENGLATNGVAVFMVPPLPCKEWNQFFDPRTTYTWGFRVPKAVTIVSAMSVTLILQGVLYEGLVLTTQRAA